MVESVSLSAPVTMQVRECIDPTIGGDASPSILTAMFGSKHHNNGSNVVNSVASCAVFPAPTHSVTL